MNPPPGLIKEFVNRSRHSPSTSLPFKRNDGSEGSETITPTRRLD
jgi:hypothetical protein